MRRAQTGLAVLALAVLTAGAAPARANWTATGTFRYRDRVQDLNGFTGTTVDLPVRYARVEIVRSPSTVLANGATDVNGNFSIPVVDATTATVFARVVSYDNISGLNIRVQSTTSGSSTYAVASGSVASHNPNTNTDFGIVTALAGAGGEAFNILDVMVNGSDYAASLAGSYPAAACTTVWSSGSITGTYYSGGTIRLLSSEGWDDAVIAHEHGHFIDDTYSATDSPGGAHFLGDNFQDIRLAWGEGVATWHMSAGRRANGLADPSFYIDTTGGSGAGNLNFSFEIEGPNVSAIGGASEVSVSAALWDIIDSAADADLYPGDDDPMNRPTSDVFEVMNQYIPTAANISLEDFWDGWFSPSINNGFAADMQATFGALTIEYFADAFESDGTPGTSSTIATDGTPQHHSFHPAGDVDVVRFVSPAPGSPFVIETSGLFSDANTALELLDTNGSTVLASNDNRSALDESSLILWTAPAAGTYFIRAQHAADLGVYGSYDLRVVKGNPSGITWTDVASTAGLASTTPGRGGAWGDYDNDGDPDLYVTAASGNNYQLFRNNGNGTFTDVATAAGVTGGGVTGEQAVWGDYDNDGDLDLYVTMIGTNRLNRNNGDGTFSNVAAGAGVAYTGSGCLGASWADYDRDGWLDLFLGTIDANDVLYHNNGNGTFTDVTAAAGVGGAGEDTFGGTWADCDNDGDLDLFVHYDGSPNRLYRNNGNGTFSDVTPVLMIEPGVRSWGALWNDYDHDGDFDLFVSNLGTPCRLYRNQGNGSFSEVGAPAGVNAAGSQTGCVMADFDNDRDDDLYLGAYEEPNLFLDNLTGLAFFNSGKAADPSQARAVTAVDFDGDGDLDLHVVQGNAAHLLYSNGTAAGSWIRLKLVGVQSNRAAIGARVTLRSGGHRYTQIVSGGGGYISQNEARLTFMLNGLAGPDSFDIRWPSGRLEMATGLARNGTRTLTEGTLTGVPVPAAPRVTATGLAPNWPNPFQRATSFRFTLAVPGPVTLDILDVQGRRVRRLVEGRFEAGGWEQSWDGRDEGHREVASGVYFARLAAPDGVVTRKLIRQP